MIETGISSVGAAEYGSYYGPVGKTGTIEVFGFLLMKRSTNSSESSIVLMPKPLIVIQSALTFVISSVVMGRT